MPPVQFAIQSYKSRALPFSAQRCVNYFAEAAPKDTKSPVVLYNTPGTKAFASGLNGAVRGSKVMGGVLYIVAGNTVYSVNSAGTATSLGTIDSTAGNVGMAVNRASPQELAIVDGTSGWTYDTSAGLVKITDGDFLAADTVTFQDGYFIFNEANTSRFFISNLDDGTAYTATDFAEAEGSPDEVVAVFSNHRELWVFGEETTEIYFNSGASDFPFERINGAYLERGCAAAFSIAADDNTLFWLGDDGVVYRADGYTPKRISTHAMEEEIRKFSTWSDAVAHFHTMSGHKFFTLTFPTGQATFVYDVSTGLWHERESFEKRYWRATTYAWVYGKHIVGDAFQGRLGELDMDTFTDYSGTMQGILQGPPVAGDRKRIFHRVFEVDIESGVGATSGDNSDPQMWLDWSNDGGRTYTVRKPRQSMGKTGAYGQRLRWKQLGQARQRIYRLTVADGVKRSIVAAHLEAAAGSQ
jgi:hypothetical protein